MQQQSNIITMLRGISYQWRRYTTYF